MRYKCELAFAVAVITVFLKQPDLQQLAGSLNYNIFLTIPSTVGASETVTGSRRTTYNIFRSL